MSAFAELRALDRHQWSAVVASVLGWTLDAFDFFLMVFMFDAIAKEWSEADLSSFAETPFLEFNGLDDFEVLRL